MEIILGWILKCPLCKEMKEDGVRFALCFPFIDDIRKQFISPKLCKHNIRKQFTFPKFRKHYIRKQFISPKFCEHNIRKQFISPKLCKHNIKK